MAISPPCIAPYAHLHEHISGPGDERPTALQVVRDEGFAGNLSHLSIAITGGDSGLGKETARALHATGARIFLLLMRGVDGDKVVQETEHSNADECGTKIQSIVVLYVDLSSLADVEKVADSLKAQSRNQLNILIFNSGVMDPPFTATQDGFEPHFGINYLSHFFLFNKLSSVLAQSSTPAFASRIVSLSSLGHKAPPPDQQSLKTAVRTPQDVSPHGYSDSKTELIWMSNEIERRFAAHGIHSFAVNPGSSRTELTAHIGWDKMRARVGESVSEMDRLEKNLEQGAATTVWGAVGKELEGHGGWYLDDVRIALPAKDGTPAFTHGFAVHAYDEKRARHLWDISEELLQEAGFPFRVCQVLKASSSAREG